MKEFVVVRVSEDKMDTYAIEVRGSRDDAMNEAIEATMADDGDTLEYVYLMATDAGAARIQRVAPGAWDTVTLS